MTTLIVTLDNKEESCGAFLRGQTCVLSALLFPGYIQPTGTSVIIIDPEFILSLYYLISIIWCT